MELKKVNNFLTHSLQKQKLKIYECIKQRKDFIKIIEEAKSEAINSYHVSTGVKIGSAVTGTGFGIMAIVGYALLIPSFGFALPLAIAGTIGSVASGVGGSAASIGHYVTENSIGKKVEDSIHECASLLNEIVENQDQVVKSARDLIFKLNNNKLSVFVSNRCVSICCEMSPLLMQDQNPTEHIIEMKENVKKKLEQLGKVGKSCYMNDTAESLHSATSVGNMMDRLSLASSNPDEAQFTKVEADLLNQFESLLNCLTVLWKIQLFGTAKSEGIEAIQLSSSTARTFVRGGLGIAEGAVGAGRAAAQTALRIVGLVSSAVFTGVDIGLTAYYSYRLHQFRQNGQSTELANSLDLLIETARDQVDELTALVNRC